MSRGKWRSLKRKEIPKVLSAYEADPGNKENTHELISMLATCQEVGNLRKYGADIEAKHAGDEETMGLLAMAYSMLCMDEDADRLYLQSLNGDPSDELVEQSDLHMKAKDLTKPKAPNRWLQSIPVLILPLVILFFLGRFIGDGISPTADNAMLVNGLSTSYTVRINGEDYTLKGNSYRRIDNIKYGENTLESVDGDTPLEALTFTIDIPVKERMVGDHAVIVNPDQTAVVLWQRDEYTTADNGDYTYELAGGETYYVYDDIDFFFMTYPDEVQVPSSKNSVFKTRVSTLNEYSDPERIEALLNHEKMEAGATFLTNKLKYEPDASALLRYAPYVLDQNNLAGLIASKLDQMPVLIEYHRYYQQQMETSEQVDQLVEEYRQRLGNHPGNKALIYLLARVEEDPNSSLKLFKEAYSGEGAGGYAAYALAYHCLLQGDPDKAEALIDQAIQRAPNNADFPAFRETVWVANKNHSALARAAEKELQSDPYNIGAFYNKLSASSLKDPSASTQQLIDSFHSKLVTDKAYDRETADNFRLELMAHANMVAGNTDSYKTSIAKTKAVGNEYIRAVLDGRISEAREFLDRNELDLSGNSHLMLYSLAMQQEKQTLANECLQAAKEKFVNGSKVTRQWAQWLNGDQAPKLSELLDNCQDVVHHYAVLIAFAHRFPEKSNAYMEHARKICYEKDFTYLALKPALKL